jgi:hypothetical protein
MEFEQTKKGLLRAEFRDRYGALCSIQESSIPGEECVWLGVDVTIEGEELRHGRMHLTRELATKLIPVLRHFARRGSLGSDGTENPYHVGAWVVGVGENNRGVEGRIVQVVPGKSLIVQNWREPGPGGHHVCAWDLVDLIWEPIDVPDRIPSRYDRLIENEDDPAGGPTDGA